MSNIIVISGPSGSGKSTLISMLQEKYSNIVFSVSHTTRNKRAGEVDGVDYHFVKEGHFKKMVEEDGFAEWAGVHGKFYGTSWGEIESKSKGSEVLFLDIDVQGAANIKQRISDAIYVFISPPSLETLKERLTGREQRFDEEIKLRLETAVNELEHYSMYDYIVVNQNLEEAFRDFEGIFRAYCCRETVKGSCIKNILEK